MKQYHEYLRNIISEGYVQNNRTGIPAVSVPGSIMRFDLQQGFPAVTTKKLFFKAVKGELIGFIRGYTSAAKFRELGCNIWNKNANEHGTDSEGNHVTNKWLLNPFRNGEDDLGRIYGAQWRSWNCAPEIDVDTGGWYTPVIDQLQVAIDTIKNDPTNRRIIINAWRPDEFDQMALPPCHVMYQFLVNVERQELNLCMYQRSCDSALGVPFNIASASLLLSLVAEVTGYTPRWFTHFLADAHIYVNHLEGVKEMLTRTPYDLPRLHLNNIGYDINNISPDSINLIDYKHHPEIEFDMAV